MRRNMRKPADMKVRTYGQHLVRINSEELPFVPAFVAQNQLMPDEMIDILLYACPRSWQKEMDRQGFDPLAHNFAQVMGFMERIEEAEDFDGTKIEDRKKSASKGKHKSHNDKGKSDKKHCMLHGWGNHSTEECETLKAQAKRMKDDRAGDKTKKFGNKTWTRKSDTSVTKNKKDLAAFITKQVKAGVEKRMQELNSCDKKRKADDSDDDLDLGCLDKELKDFNYEDMDNLKIDDDDSDEASC